MNTCVFVQTPTDSTDHSKSFPPEWYISTMHHCRDTPFWLENLDLQTCLPQSTSVSTPNSMCPYFQISDGFFSMHHQSIKTKQKSVKGQHFYNSLQEQCVNSHFQLYRRTTELHTMTLGCLFRLFLFTSAKVVLDQRLQNIFSKRNAPHELLSLIPTHSFLNGCCLASLHFSSKLSV